MMRTSTHLRVLWVSLLWDVFRVNIDFVDALHEEGAEVEAVLGVLVDAVDALLLVHVHDSEFWVHAISVPHVHEPHSTHAHDAPHAFGPFADEERDILVVRVVRAHSGEA